MTTPDDLVKKLRRLSVTLLYPCILPVGRYRDVLLEAADMIEQMEQRIEADAAAYNELERRQL
jgi:hypothetical protein